MHRQSGYRAYARYSSGFSLMEMAIVLMIMGILMSGVLVSVSQTTLNARRANALAQMRNIEDALYGYAQTYGRLPCPALADGTGLENVSAGNCVAIHGFVPSATLGFDGPTNEDGLLLDPWQSPYRYSLASVSAANFDSSTGIDSFFAAGTAFSTTLPNQLMQICTATTCTASEELTRISPAVVMSLGEDWANAPSSLEQENASSASTDTGSVTGNVYNLNSDYRFVSASYIEDQFDDQLVWLSPYVLFNRMVSAGRLP